jgi:hypothetical protein
MDRVVINLIGRAYLDDIAQVHHGDAVRDVPDDRQVVRDEDVGKAELLLQVLHQIDDLRLNRHVERTDRLVGDDDLRVGCKGPRDADPLPLPSRELVGIALDVFGRQSNLLHQPEHTLASFVGGLFRVNLQRLADDLADAHARVERGVRVLKNHLELGTIRPHLAPVE